jgi:hypothetical protein
MATLALIVNWHGPFKSIIEAKESTHKNNLKEVLYLATGKCKYERLSKMQYVGISNNLKSRFNDQTHPISCDIRKEMRIWIGLIVSHGVAGRKAAAHPAAHSLGVETAEWALAYFLKLPLNTKKRRKPPPRALVLLNRWYKDDFATRWLNKKNHTQDWPDFIEYDPAYASATLQWFGAPPRRKRYEEGAIHALALPLAVG